MFELRRFALVAALVACGSTPPKPAAPPPAREEVAAAPPAPHPAPVHDPDDDPLPLWPEVHKGTLPNGMTYYIMKHGKPEHRAMLWLAVNAGSVDEDDDQRGLAHFDEHMAFNGTKRFPKQEIVNYLERIGMRFGADLNAYTTWQQTVYQLEVPTTDKDGKPTEEFLGKGLDVLRDWAGEVSYDPTEVQKERGVVKEEWRLGRGAGMRLFDKESKVLFAGSRYADRITIGKPEIIDGAPRDTLYRFYKDWYRPDLMAVIAVGDVDPAMIQKAIESKFGDLKSTSTRKKVAAGVPKATGTRVSIETDHEAMGTDVTIYNLVAHRPKSSRRDVRRLAIDRVYGEIINERLSAVRRRPEAPFLSAFASIGGETREIDSFTRGAQAKEGRAEDALRALYTEVLRVERHGVTQPELDRARVALRRSYETQESREATNDSRAFTGEIVRNFLESEFMVGAKAEKELFLAVLPNITVADLDAEVKSFGTDGNRVVVVSGPDNKPLPTKDRVLQIIAEVEKSDIPAWQDKPVPTTLMEKPPAPGKIVKDKKVDAIGVTEWTLSNGARVIAKPTDFENDTIVMQAYSPGGTALVKDKDYNDVQFATEVADSGGVADFDSETLQKILTGKQLRVNEFVTEVSEGLRANSSVKDLETMFQLVHLRMTAPRKDVEQFEVWKANRAEQIVNFERLPEIAFTKAMQSWLYKDNPRRSFPKPEDIKRVNQDAALAFYKDRFGDASDFTFVFVGSFELDKLKPLVETYLASLPGKKRVEKEKDLGIRKPTGVATKDMKIGQEPKARVQIDFHADDNWTRDKERDVQILSRVLSIRLREVLREDLGGVYGVGAFGGVSRSPHQERSFGVTFGCAPERVPELIAATFTEIGKLAAAPKTPASADDKKAKDKKDLPIDDDDLAEYLGKVKETYLRERETSLRQNGFWASQLTTAYRYGDDPKDIPDTDKIVARMKPALVRAAAKHYLDKKQYTQVVMLPGEGVAPAPATAPAKK